MFFVTVQRLATSRAGAFANLNVFQKIGTIVRCPRENVVFISSRFLNGKTSCGEDKPILGGLQRSMFLSSKFNGVKGIQENISALQMKKRPLRKKRSVTEDEEAPMPGYWTVKALATAEEYNLEGLMDGLIKQDLYMPRKICTSTKCK